MQSLSVETITPLDQQGKSDAASYQIKPISELQLCEVLSDGAIGDQQGNLKLNFQGVKKCLAYGLQDPSKMESMKAMHMLEVARAIFTKALLSQAEEKN